MTGVRISKRAIVATHGCGTRESLVEVLTVCSILNLMGTAWNIDRPVLGSRICPNWSSCWRSSWNGGRCSQGCLRSTAVGHARQAVIYGTESATDPRTQHHQNSNHNNSDEHKDERVLDQSLCFFCPKFWNE